MNSNNYFDDFDNPEPLDVWAAGIILVELIEGFDKTPYSILGTKYELKFNCQSKMLDIANKTPWITKDMF